MIRMDCSASQHLETPISPEDATSMGIVVTAELVLMTACFGLTAATLSNLRYTSCPFVWFVSVLEGHTISDTTALSVARCDPYISVLEAARAAIVGLLASVRVSGVRSR